MTLNLAQVRVDLMAVRDERAESITLRRGDSTVSAQTVRIERTSSFGMAVRSLNGEEYRATAIVLGDIDLDIEVQDRFNDQNGIVFVVIFVNPNRDACCVAEVAAVE